MRQDAFNFFLTLIIRGFGGLAGVLPAIVALQILDRAQYGKATANYAIALILIGPMQQYLAQGYLRSLRGALSVFVPPAGSIPLWIYVAIVEIGVSALGFTGILATRDALLIGITFLPALWVKAQESAFISRGWPNAAAALFSIFPPCTQCFLIVIMKKLHAATDFEIVSIAQISALISCATICFITIPQAWQQIIPLKFPTSKKAWAHEFAAVQSFVISGAVLSVTEQIPVVLLRFFQFEYVIATFELARKIASVPSLIVNAFDMHLSVRLIDQALEGAWVKIRKTLRSFIFMQAPLGLVYVGTAVTMLLVFKDSLPFLRQLEPSIWAPLLLGSLVTTFAAPFGALLIALRGDQWWAIGSIASLTVQLAVSFIGRDSLGVSSVCWGILIQNITLTSFVAYGALSIYSEKSSKTDFNYGTEPRLKRS